MEQSSTRTYEPLTARQLRTLHNRISNGRVATREGMSYLEAWDVKATLIRVFGYAGFSTECLEAKIIREEQVPQSRNPEKMNWSVTAQATVRVTIHQTGAVYTEAAIANNKQPDWAEAADTALKSAESDALKRAATLLGTQFGLSLYDSGRTSDVVKTVVAPEQATIVDDINTMRANTPESQAAHDRLQAAMNVHPPSVTETPAVAAEPTLTEPTAVVNVATLTAPPVGGVVAKALENAERVAAELDQAEQPPKDRKPAPRKNTRKAQPAESVTADRQAVARQALATAEQRVGLTLPSHYEEDFAVDDELQIAEDAQ